MLGILKCAEKAPQGMKSTREIASSEKCTDRNVVPEQKKNEYNIY